MSFEKILTRFRLISGVSDDEAYVWREVVSEAMEYIRSLANTDDLTESDINRLNNAAAVYAYYKYACYTDDAEGSFKAGDISISPGNSVLAARTMWESEKEAVSDLMKGTGFVFGRIL